MTNFEIYQLLLLAYTFSHPHGPRSTLRAHWPFCSAIICARLVLYICSIRELCCSSLPLHNLVIQLFFWSVYNSMYLISVALLWVVRSSSQNTFMSSECTISHLALILWMLCFSLSCLYCISSLEEYRVAIRQLRSYYPPHSRHSDKGVSYSYTHSRSWYSRSICQKHTKSRCKVSIASLFVYLEPPLSPPILAQSWIITIASSMTSFVSSPIYGKV